MDKSKPLPAGDICEGFLEPSSATEHDTLNLADISSELKKQFSHETNSNDTDSDNQSRSSSVASSIPKRQIIPTHQLTNPTTVSWRVRILHDDKYSDPECVAIYEKGEEFDLQVSAAGVSARDISQSNSVAFLVQTDAFEQGYMSDTAVTGASRFVKGRGKFPRKSDLDKLRITQVSPPNLLIISVSLELALEWILGESPQYPDGNAQSVPCVRAPYVCFVHHYEQINHLADGNGIAEFLDYTKNLEVVTDLDKEVVLRHVQALRDYLTPHYYNIILPLGKSLTTEEPKITFDMVGYIFPSGTDVYVLSASQIHVCVVSRVNSMPNPFNQQRIKDANKSPSWDFELWRLLSDGTRVARTPENISIGYFEGSKDIRSLPVCPIGIWDRHDNFDLRTRLLKQNGLHLAALKAGNMLVRYDGTDQLDGRRIKSKMVIDYLSPSWEDKNDMGFEEPIFDTISHTTFQSYDYLFLRDSEAAVGQRRYDSKQRLSSPAHPPSDDYEYRQARYVPSPPPQRLENDYAPVTWKRTVPIGARSRRPINLQEKARYATKHITEHQLLLLDPVAPAFSLTTKQWHLINVGHIEPVEVSENSMNHLVMDEFALETLRALASRRHKAIDNWSVDFIEGKGMGQIILLHGPPGVGKTFTVESIAEWLQRPLLSLTVADLGTQEINIEQELMKWFELAEAWEGVVLVDEADIFLERRKTRDLARNGLVTALLRRMEYFKGLLFLTTNRVGQIDDAFMSRIHTAIEYKTLTHTARQKIWNGFFEKLHLEQKGKIMIGRSAKRYVLEHEAELNGREIRNVLQTAISLAAFQAEKDSEHASDEPVVVEEGHFKDVLDMSEKFHKYVNDIRDEDLKRRAYQRGDRLET